MIMKTLSWNTTSENDRKHFDVNEVFEVGMKHHAIANTAWPIAHNKTMNHYKLSEEEIQNHIVEAWKWLEEMCLYIHIPFCEKICNFCEYSVMNPKIKSEQEPLYFDALRREIELYRDHIETKSKRLLGFDIGGGTPSSVDTHYIEGILRQVDDAFTLPNDINISIETTPKIVAEDIGKIQDYFRMGIRRISMGVQSIKTASIGRESTSTEWNKKATEHIRKAGFEQFNIDLMYGFANQTVDDVRASINHVLSLDPEFVTLYRMRYKGTNVEDKAQNISLEEVNAQYFALKEILKSAGYEVRNGKNTFSKVTGNDGLSDYLHHRVERGIPYLGLGQWAQSYNPYNTLSYNRWASLKHPLPYYKKLERWEFPLESVHHLSREASMAKMIAVSFYSGGIHKVSFQKIFWVTLEEAFREEVDFVKKEGFMVDDEVYGTLQLTELGTKFYSGVIALFYNGEVKNHLLSLDENKWMKWLWKRERRIGRK